MNKNMLYLLVILLISMSGFTQEDANSTFLEREHLLGDWGGARSYLEDRGLNLELIYTAELFRNVSGGQRTGGDYRGDISLFMELDTETAGWWDNGTFFVHLQEQHGYGITNKYVGDSQVLSNIDADDYKQISEIWYLHRLLDDRLWIKLGKMEGNADFAFVDYGGEFINSSAGFHPTIPLVTYPDQDWGVVVGIEPVDWFSMNIGVYQGRPDGGRSISSTLDNLYGPMLMIEPAFHYTIWDRSGHLRIGGWWNGDRFDELDLSNPAPGTFGESYGFYLSSDQVVWKENQDDEDEQGIGVFAQYGFSPEERSEINHYIGGGVKWIGAISTRDDDVIGLGIFHIDFSDEAGLVDNGETAVELFYKYQALGWMSLKPEVQYITNPGGVGADDALALGVRIEISF